MLSCVACSRKCKQLGQLQTVKFLAFQQQDQSNEYLPVALEINTAKGQC